MKVLRYIGKMLVLSAILTVAINLLILFIRFFPFEIFTQWAWRFNIGGMVVVIPWFAMVVLSVIATVLQFILRKIKK